ncbi:MAG: hypothetical protein JW947_08505, partial [Sedimentisphaerales bacterium]|nr:hypothetical protein [Sedimentisphaerales bacterium]
AGKITCRIPDCDIPQLKNPFYGFQGQARTGKSGDQHSEAGGRNQNSKYETRNTKQIRITKKDKIQN